MYTGEIIDRVVKKEKPIPLLGIKPRPSGPYQLTLLTELLWLISIIALVSKHHIMKVHRGDRGRTSCYFKYHFKIKLW
jgi:hypothetical protein